MHAATIFTEAQCAARRKHPMEITEMLTAVKIYVLYGRVKEKREEKKKRKEEEMRF